MPLRKLCVYLLSVGASAKRECAASWLAEKALQNMGNSLIAHGTLTGDLGLSHLLGGSPNAQTGVL